MGPRRGSFSAVVVAPVELVTPAVNASWELPRYVYLYVYGIYSRILTNIIRIAGSFEIRRASTSHQLLTILHEAYRETGIDVASGMKISYIVRDAKRYMVDTEGDASLIDPCITEVFSNGKGRDCIRVRTSQIRNRHNKKQNVLQTERRLSFWMPLKLNPAWSSWQILFRIVLRGEVVLKKCPLWVSFCINFSGDITGDTVPDPLAFDRGRSGKLLFVGIKTVREVVPLFCQKISTNGFYVGWLDSHAQFLKVVNIESGLTT
jgi:hypothetical protein